MTTFLFLAVALVICIWLFFYLDRTHRRQDAAYKAQQPEQPEQSETDYERPNVFYSKDIQIVSEPAYLIPPFRFDDIYLMKVEAKDNIIFVWFFIEANLISIQINNSQLYDKIMQVETEHKTETCLLAQAYLYEKNILK